MKHQRTISVDRLIWLLTAIVCSLLVPITSEAQPGYDQWQMDCIQHYDGAGNVSPRYRMAEELMVLNKEKNNTNAPSDAIDSNITLSDLARKSQSSDADRFTKGTAVEITGYVLSVSVGGIETCNCKTTDSNLRDTHIALVTKRSGADATQSVVVEITPQIRHAMNLQHVDWSTATLHRTLIGKKITVQGWLLFDSEHIQNAVNTQGSANLWRRTCWEVHPITSLHVLKSNGSVDTSSEGINGEYHP